MPNIASCSSWLSPVAVLTDFSRNVLRFLLKKKLLSPNVNGIWRGSFHTVTGGNQPLRSNQWTSTEHVAVGRWRQHPLPGPVPWGRVHATDNSSRRTNATFTCKITLSESNKVPKCLPKSKAKRFVFMGGEQSWGGGLPVMLKFRVSGPHVATWKDLLTNYLPATGGRGVCGGGGAAVLPCGVNGAAVAEIGQKYVK